MLDDTICAIASPPTGALRGIIRVSGQDALSILGRCLADPASVAGRASRRIEAAFQLGEPFGDLLAAALVWPTRGSYTGQPVVELHLPGAMPILNAAIEKLVQAGARPARPGEFTLRAFLAGRLDLTQAEAVLGVIDAEDAGALQASLDQLAGGLGKPLQLMRGRLLDLLSHVEAGLDFVDEDIEFIADEELIHALQQIAAPLAAIGDQLVSRDRATSVPLVILRGKPNAGKSRLLNALSRRETAIVADQAGTTRDPVESLVQCGHQTIRFADTAGIEAGATEIDRDAQTLAAEIERRADLRLYCVELAQSVDAIERDVRRFQEGGVTQRYDPATVLYVGTKADLCGISSDGPVSSLIPAEQFIATSSVTGEGLPALVQAVSSRLDRLDRQETRGVAGTAARCRASIDRASAAIGEAIELIRGGGSHDLAAAEMRLALSALGEVTGEVYTDDILDRIFSRFCIGK